jgi:hypothetical protein
MVHLPQTVDLSCTDINTISKQTEMRFHMTHVTKVFYRVFPKHSNPTVCSTQTMHLSCAKISTISKRIEMSRSSIWCVQNNFEPLVRSAQTVHLSCIKISTISKQTKSSFHMILVTQKYQWPRSKRFLRLWYIWCKLCTDLAPTLTLSPNRPKRDST